MIDQSAKLNLSDEYEAIAQARAAIGNPICDPEQATSLLLQQAEQGLSKRADALANQYRRIHFRLTTHVQRTIAAKEAVIDPQHIELDHLQAEGAEILAELESLLKIRDDPATSKKMRREMNVKAESRLAKLEEIEKKMKQALTPIGMSLKQMEEEIAIAAPLWAGIQGAERIASNLRMSLVWARIQSSFLRLIFFSVALGLAVLADRYTSVAESNLASIATGSRHDVAISGLFFLQAIFFEPVFSRLKRALASKVHVRLTRNAETLLMKIEEYEKQMARAETSLARLETTVP